MSEKKMEDVIIFWFLSTYAVHHGYGLTPKERKQLFPYSDNIMQKYWERWLLEKKQAGEF